MCFNRVNYDSTWSSVSNKFLAAKQNVLKFQESLYLFEKQPPECSVKKVFLKISQNSQKTCARGSFLIKLQALDFNLLLPSIEATVQPSMFQIKEQPKHWFGIFLLL